MLGVFGIFGRSQEMQRLDQAFRDVGLHPRAVSDAVKLATLKQLKEADGGTANVRACAAAAELIGYCALGVEDFTAANGIDHAGSVEARLIAAIESGRSLDARLVLLTLHAGVTHPSVVERYSLAIE